MRTLLVLILISIKLQLYCQVEYGNNQAAGKFHDVGDAKIYYEVYGAGTPLILLHGGLYGYIDDYSDYIPALQKDFKVIAIATRGHGKSEIGTKDYSENLLASDVISILAQETTDSAVVVGFSAGAATAYYLAAYYLEKIKGVAAIGAVINRDMQSPEVKDEIRNYSWNDFLKRMPDFFAQRQKLMPEPERADEWVNQLKSMWIKNVLSAEEVSQIKCPVLIVGGDREDHSSPSAYVDTYHSIPSSRLSIIPYARTTDLLFNQETFNRVVMPFIMDLK